MWYTSHDWPAHAARARAFTGDVRAWHTHRFDWARARTDFYADGVRMHAETLNVAGVASHFLVNVWGNGGPWVGPARPGDATQLEVRWMEMAWNTTGAERGCARVCELPDN